MGGLSAFEDGLSLDAERLCLDFANTLDWHASEHPIEKLVTYADLVAWAERKGLLGPERARALQRTAARRPDDAERVLEKARSLREAMYAIFLARIAGQAPAPADQATLNRALAEALGHARLELSAQGFAWRWDGDERPLDWMLWPVVQSAVDLLTSPEVDRLGQCADDRGCGFLFLDMTKNRSRMWCDMKACGNRAKARRFYSRQRAPKAN